MRPQKSNNVLMSCHQCSLRNGKRTRQYYIAFDLNYTFIILCPPPSHPVRSTQACTYACTCVQGLGGKDRQNTGLAGLDT